MSRTIRFTLAALLIAAVAFVGTTRSSAQQSMTDRAQDEMNQSIDRGQEGMDRAQQGITGTGSYQQGQLPQGITPKDVGNARDEIRDSFAGAVKAALTRDNFKDLTGKLAKSDRDRLNVTDNKYNERLNSAIDQFNQAWKSKFNDDFSFDADQAFSDQYLSVTTGEVSDAQKVDQWPLHPTGKKDADWLAGKPTMNQGTEVAIATFSGAQAQPIWASLVREGTDWKIDIPDQFNHDQIQDNLARHITELTTAQGQWPSDQATAHRIVASHVLLGLYGVKEGHQGGQPGMSQMPSTSPGSQQGHEGHQHDHQGMKHQEDQGMQSEEQSSDEDMESSPE